MHARSLGSQYEWPPRSQLATASRVHVKYTGEVLPHHHKGRLIVGAWRTGGLVWRGAANTYIG